MNMTCCPVSRPAEDYDNLCDNEMRPAWHPLSMRALHPTGLGTLLTLGLRGVGQTASEWWAWELVGLAASLLGPTALAAQSVLLVSCSTTYQAPFAVGVATSVRIGQLLGLARPRLANLAAHAALLLGLALSLVFSAIFWIWRKRWAYVFNDDEDVAEMVARILPLVALFQVFDGNAAITGGILRARGKQGTGALLNLRSVFSLIEVFGVVIHGPTVLYYVLGVPPGVYLAFKNIGLPESLPDHPTISTQAMAMFTAPSSMPSPSFPLPSLHLQPLFNGLAQASSNQISFNDIDKIVEDPMYPSLPEATAGLRGLWIGLTVSLVYCAVIGTALCLATDWKHELDKVQARVQAEDRRNQQENGTLHVEDQETIVGSA
ncbi:mate-domain-containing protein [Lentinula raphanica]|nr:mate-domain-containing protein [Lentinula raphanica]